MNDDLETIIREVYSSYDVRYGNAIVDLKQRIDKAVEYLKRLQEKELITEFETSWLIEVLEGSDKE